MGITLRPYQQAAVDAVYTHLSTREDNPCVVLPTGTGKSLVIAQIVKDAVGRWGGRVLVLAHVKELLVQNAEKIRALCGGIRVGVYSAGLGRRESDAPVVVAGIQSVYRKARDLGGFDLVVVDEAHLIPPDGEGEYRTFLDAALEVNPRMRVVGLTATPYRMHGGLICKPENILNHVCYEAGLKEMISQGYLAPLTTKEGDTAVDVSAVHVRAGEFVQAEVEAAVCKDSIVRSACHEIVRMTAARRAVLVFCVSVEHCRQVAACISAASGQECAVVTGDTSPEVRRETLARLRGESVPADLFGAVKPPLKYVANVNVLTTGFDAPSVDCVAILRPTLSAGLLVQMVGRGTRLCEGKKNCLVLDFGGNIMRHGPVDAIRVHDFGSGRRRAEPKEPPVRKCPSCRELVPTTYSVCPACGTPFPPPEVHHDAMATTAAILSGAPSTSWADVEETSYMVWRKRDARPEDVSTVRVTYRTGLADFVSEWVCPEHQGYARSKFIDWWKARTAASVPVPSDAEHAVWLANLGVVSSPARIRVKVTSGERFPRITAYDLPDAEEPTEEQMITIKDYESQHASAVAQDESGIDYQWDDMLPF